MWVSHGVESCRSFLRPVDGDGNLTGGGTQAFVQVSVSGELGYCCSLDPHLQQPQLGRCCFPPILLFLLPLFNTKQTRTDNKNKKEEKQLKAQKLMHKDNKAKKQKLFLWNTPSNKPHVCT